MKPLRVCHMTSVHPAEDVRIFQKECVSLAQAGYEVYLVERGDSYDKNGVHIVGVGELPAGRLRRMTEGAGRVCRTALSLDCDLYHLHDPELLPYGMKLKKRGKTVIFDSHELYRKQIEQKPYLPRWAASLAARLYAGYEDRILRAIDGVVFPCPVDGAFPLPGKHRALVNNVPRLAELYDRYDPSAEKSTDVCMVGSLSYARGITHLLRAADRADCAIQIGGTFSSAAYETEVRAMKEAQNAGFLGRLDREQVFQLLQHAKVGVSVLLNVGQYSEVENLPTKAYEYMSMGLPVLLARTRYNQRMMEEYRFGMCVDPENIEEYANAIRYLLDHPDAAREMGENGRRAIRERFNWEAEFQNLLALYQAVADG